MRIDLLFFTFAFAPLLAASCVTGPRIAEGEGESGGEGEGDAGGEGEGEGEGAGEGEGEGEGEGPACGDLARVQFGSCTSFVCGDPIASSLAFESASGGSPSIVSSALPSARFAIGSARSDVEAALGNSGDDVGDSLHKRFCDVGLQLEFARKPGRPDSIAAPTDILVSLKTLPGATASSPQCVVAIGQLWTNPPLFGEETVVHQTAAGTSVVIYGDLGIEAVLDRGGYVQEIELVFPEVPLADDARSLPIGLGAQTLSLGTLTLGTSTFANIGGALGGQAEVTDPITIPATTPQEFDVQVFRSLGIQLAGPCDASCSDGSLITSVALTEPFLGVTSQGLGVQSTRADFDSALGTGSAVDSNGFVAYSNGVAVLFSEADDCSERAAMVVLGYDEASSLLLFSR
jgi:hypothetical protein